MGAARRLATQGIVAWHKKERISSSNTRQEHEEEPGEGIHEAGARRDRQGGGVAHSCPKHGPDWTPISTIDDWKRNGGVAWHQQTSNYTTLPQSPASSSLPSPGTLPWAMATQLEGNNLCFIASTRSLPFTPLSPMQHKDRYPSFSYVSRQQFACFSSLPGLFLQQKKHDKADPVRRAVGPCLYAGQYPMGTWR